MFALIAFLVVYGLLECEAQRIHAVAGPFRIVPDHVEHCPSKLFEKKGEQAIWYFKNFRDRVNLDKWYYYGNYTTHFWFSDDMNIELAFASWSTRGGWKENAIIIKMKQICKAAKTYLPKQWKNVMYAILPNNASADCPFPPALYYLRNATADLGVARRVPAFYYGKWRLDAKIMDPEWDCVSCMRILMNIVPQTKYESSKLGVSGVSDGDDRRNTSNTNGDSIPVDVQNPPSLSIGR
ncbi:Queuine tRNA-ribosyltransferase [Frankliniella fusca]|uniref:Queuine tRNA-ribosyltransferase n=1 Tax=Frankliniella fusca TaxID=407009 RepID=A0AAE1H0F9_9NEOP|nr:Queuine tRNA-ribosyltransferase [Frankliniella fusca]